MSAATPTRAGLSAKHFKLYATEAGEWLWGTVQGAFNEQQSLSQIITDAVIGMIPVVGDVTAARDLIAVSSGLINHPEKRENKLEWVLLVILIFALIPVIGGVIKGVGRLALKVTANVAKDTTQVAKVAQEIIAFLNRIGHMNAEAWLKSLDVMKYQAELVAKFRTFCDTVILCIHRYGLRFKRVLPNDVVLRMEQLSHGFQQLKALGSRMIPEALKELHQKLAELQKFIHAGGVPPPSKSKVILAQTGKKTVTYAEEARILEGKTRRRVIHAGKYKQNVASSHPAARASIDRIYRHEAGFPDMLARTDKAGFYPNIASASGPIKNEQLSGVTLFRAFGPGGKTRGLDIGDSRAIGPYWGIGPPPATAKEWREECAVLDEWNRNGWLSIIHVPPTVKVNGCTSVVAEQFGKDLPEQFLKGGARQAFIEAFFDKQFTDATAQLYKQGGGKQTLANGIVVEIRKSGWHDVNGLTGYGKRAIPDATMVERLGITEKQTKVAGRAATQAAQGTAKHERQQ